VQHASIIDWDDRGDFNLNESRGYISEALVGSRTALICTFCHYAPILPPLKQQLFLDLLIFLISQVSPHSFCPAASSPCTWFKPRNHKQAHPRIPQICLTRLCDVIRILKVRGNRHMLHAALVLWALASAVAFTPLACISQVHGRPAACSHTSTNPVPIKKARPLKASGIAHSQTLRGAALTLQLFKHYDSDKSNTITAVEFKEILRAGMQHKTSRSVEMEETASGIASSVLFKRADLDGNGVLSYNEFERLMTMLVSTSMVAPLSQWLPREDCELQPRNKYAH